MRRKLGCLLGGGIVLALGVLLVPTAAAGVDDFTLTRAIPADAMIAVHARRHDGLEFVNEQYARIWAAIEKQHFEKDLRRMIRTIIKEEGGDIEEFEARWQQITDLAAGVHWAGLAEREFAFTLRLGGSAFPVDMVYLMIPAEGDVQGDFDGLTAILKNMIDLAPENTFVLTTESEGETVIHTVKPTEPIIPAKFTLARHGDVLLIAFGSTMVDQCLALLSGETDAAGATLASTERFQQAFKRLPPPQDSLHFVDIGKLLEQGRSFAQMGAAAAAANLPQPDPNDPNAKPPANPLEALPKLVGALDIWDYTAGVTSTEGMQTRMEQITVLRSDAKDRPLYRVLHSGGPLREPLKYIPKEATDVSVFSGFDLGALYREALKFINDEVPDGPAMLAQWDAMQIQFELDVEKEVLGWIGNSYASFSAPIPTPFLPGWVWIIEVRDEQQANQSLDRLTETLNTLLIEQNGGVENAELEDAPGFRRVILPPMFAMVPGLGRPIFGVKDGRLFVANGPEVAKAALQAGVGETFAKNERYLAEGLPLEGDTVAFGFRDLSKLGETLGQMLPAMAFMARMVPEIQSNPVATTMLNVLTKAGNVCKELDFLKSSCSVTTFAGNIGHTKSVTNYQQPPRAQSAAAAGSSTAEGEKK